MLNFNEETVDIGTRPKNTIKAVLDNGIYKFYGWYTDEECTVPVIKTVGEDIVISGTEDNQIRPPAANKDMTYYAKYDYRRGDLNISVTGDDVTTGGQPFEFTVKGTDSHNNWIELIVCIKPDTKQSVTIKDLPIGNYTVTQNSWSWRYQTPEQLEKTVNEGETVTATFSEVISNKKWFDGNAYCNNRFT